MALFLVEDRDFKGLEWGVSVITRSTFSSFRGGGPDCYTEVTGEISCHGRARNCVNEINQ